MRYPNAIWRGASDEDFSRRSITPKFVVVHVTQGDGSPSGWFHDPRSQVSAHFGVLKDGTVEQYVDTDFEAYAECAFNGVGISIEHEGFSGERLTDQQCTADMILFAWLRRAHRIPWTWRENAFGSRGYVGHGELGIAGGNHPRCPGDPIITDVRAILAVLKTNRKVYIG